MLARGTLGGGVNEVLWQISESLNGSQRNTPNQFCIFMLSRFWCLHLLFCLVWKPECITLLMIYTSKQCFTMQDKYIKVSLKVIYLVINELMLRYMMYWYHISWPFITHARQVYQGFSLFYFFMRTRFWCLRLLFCLVYIQF